MSVVTAHPHAPARAPSAAAATPQRARRGHEPASAQAQTRQWFEAEPLWFKRAVFYEIHVRGFFDANGDGSGDFRGLTEKLDYLQWLGIDCIWLLPFYQLAAARRRLRHLRLHRGPPRLRHRRRRPAADRRRPRAADPGDRRPGDEPHLERPPVVPGVALAAPTNPKRDWYVWSDTDDRYQDARIIFIDTESSNWTWDPVAGAYYWHRFFSHQPDLNYDNPEVQEAMLDVLRFWLDLGLDGFRLDAVPVPVRARGHQLREPPRDPRLPEAGPQGDRRALPRPGAARRGQPVARRRRRSTSATATSARWRSTSR